MSAPGPRRAVVTGAAGGIGAAVAARLAEDGLDVLVTDIDGTGAERTARAIGARAARLDVTDHDAVAELLGAERFDVLVNNAGCDDFGWFTDVTAQRWRRVLAVNVEGVFACTRAVLPAMQRARYGRIVTVTSEAGRIGSKGNAVYAAAKAAVIGFSKSIARENARYGITVNCVAPGPTDTPMVEAIRRGPDGERVLAALVAGTQLGRLGTPEEIAAAVCFLASPEASYITAETLGVSGGMGLGA
ncbi:2-hydroxycyclohexanecarboxyl-CoA dehydrogenase [Pseudonocardia thermophila]|uniref:2-hydroxycyclohexanecarboxyl-CoA dehydrogenase n=1 Tax=Pseudonocardia thermophila TaxID=1848 RepID=A0A1M6Y1J6_PSETH|nr:SDR family oxidoreductase [Pseudonocardia thermophila]SHL11993.1 2-hydroxycyclohexanecarboxyl-CoA dehydrogenase [Pseudonocardia thermophila]